MTIFSVTLFVPTFHCISHFDLRLKDSFQDFHTSGFYLQVSALFINKRLAIFLVLALFFSHSQVEGSISENQRQWYHAWRGLLAATHRVLLQRRLLPSSANEEY